MGLIVVRDCFRKSPSPLHLLASTLEPQLRSAFLSHILYLDDHFSELDGLYQRPDHLRP